MVPAMTCAGVELSFHTEVANMRARHLAAALVLGVAAGNVQAAPLPRLADAMPSPRMLSPFMAEMPVAYRRCRRRDGQRYCRWSHGPSAEDGAYGYTGSDYYEQDSRKLPVGSQRWWDIKEREGSTGRP
jgi:hypothetical protein